MSGQAVIDADVVERILIKHNIDYECFFVKPDELDIDQFGITTTINADGYVRFTIEDRTCGEHWKYLKKFRARDIRDKGLNICWFGSIKPALSELCKIIQKGEE